MTTPAVALRTAMARLLLWRRRAVERSELLRLDDRALRDFGVSRSEAQGEAHKPFWCG